MSEKKPLLQRDEEEPEVEIPKPPGYWQTPQKQLQVQAFLYAVFWLGLGFLFYGTCQEHWTKAERIFFAVNVGLGIGYGFPVATRPDSIFFTCIYCLLGTSVMMASMGVVIQWFLSTVPEKRIWTGNWYNRMYQLGSSPRCLLTVAYAAWFAIGVVFCQWYMDMAPVDAWVFTISAMTTAGLINPRDDPVSLYFTTVYVLIGIPLHAAFWGSVVDYCILAFLNALVPTKEARPPSLPNGRYSQMYAKRPVTKEEKEVKLVRWLICTWTVSQVMFFIWFLCMVIFVAFSTWLYWYLEPDWDWYESFYWVINVGLGVGFGDLSVGGFWTKAWTVVFCAIGTSLFMSFVVFMVSFMMEISASTTKCEEDDDEAIAKLRVKIWAIFSYGVWLALGVWVCMHYMDFMFRNGLLFCITAMTTSGLLNPTFTDGGHLFTALYILVGIPLNGVAWGAIMDDYVSFYVEQDYWRTFPSNNETIYRGLILWSREARANLASKMQAEKPKSTLSSMYSFMSSMNPLKSKSKSRITGMPRMPRSNLILDKNYTVDEEQRWECERVFNRFAGRNGEVMQSRLGDLLRQLGHEPSDEEVASMSNRITAENKRSFDLEFFVKMVAQRQQTTATDTQILEAFTLWDSDHNGLIGFEELDNVLFNLEIDLEFAEVEEMIRLADKDGDLYISYDEFIDYLAKFR